MRGDLFTREIRAKDPHPLIDRLFRRQVPGPVTLAILCASTPLTPTTMTDLSGSQPPLPEATDGPGSDEIDADVPSTPST